MKAVGQAERLHIDLVAKLEQVEVEKQAADSLCANLKEKLSAMAQASAQENDFTKKLQGQVDDLSKELKSSSNLVQEQTRKLALLEKVQDFSARC